MNDVRCTATTIQAGKQGACVMVGFLVARCRLHKHVRVVGRYVAGFRINNKQKVDGDDATYVPMKKRCHLCP